MQKQSSVSSTPQNDDVHPTQDTTKLPHHFYLNKEVILDEKRSREFLVTHLQTSKFATETTRDIYLYPIKECPRVLKTQKYLSKFEFSLNGLKCFQKKHLLLTIQHFSSLSSLSLIFSDVQGVQFKGLASLKHLNSLDISFDYLAFDDPNMFKKLMKTIRKTTKISSLSLRFFCCKALSPLHYQTLSSNLTKLTPLKTLKLSFEHSNNLTQRDINTLASGLSKLTSLTQIELVFKGQRTIQELILISLFKAFQNLKNLSALALNLKQCAFAFFDCGDGSIMESVKCLTMLSLKRLSLNLFWNFSDQNLRELSEVLKELTSLKSLCLNFDGGFNISNESLAAFILTLSNLIPLTNLDLIFPPKMKNLNLVQQIADALESLQNLVFLKLEFAPFSQIQDSHLKMLFANLKALNCIKHLDLQISDQKMMTDSSLEVLGESLRELNLLRNLSLGFNSAPLITNKGIGAICSGIQGLLNLFSLNLQLSANENLTGKAIRKISKTLKGLVYLYSIELNFHDCLSINDFGELFNVLVQVKHIQEITLSMPHSEPSKRDVDCLEKIKKKVTAYLYLGKGWSVRQHCG